MCRKRLTGKRSRFGWLPDRQNGMLTVTGTFWCSYDPYGSVNNFYYAMPLVLVNMVVMLPILGNASDRSWG